MSKGGSINPLKASLKTNEFDGRKRINSDFNEFEDGKARRLPESLVSMRSASFGRSTVGSSKDSIHRTLLRDETADISLSL